ncbi:Flavin-linked sulfhydryl oxidase of the mitochondrial IMS [Tieghemiomyces parasiticus]|uniref:Sulfhydryl oxidase n=1 Tax=Tieghemiomyces parasiticus TaxID=78921 RepID=A0A9W7ZT82_9FUNG|nr:Flavin-linked sulfhydryl oxidase of the mitochondrial IMS [Tieghemiomyces parasiticus]
MGASIDSLNPDTGKDCRVCTDFKTWTKRKRQEATSSTRGASSQSSGTATAASSTAAAAAAAAGLTTTPVDSDRTSFDRPPPVECPPDSEQLGRSTWTFLHTMAAYYPDQPNPQQQGDMRSLLANFSKFYPCGYCASHLREEMKTDPPVVDSRQHLSLWMCQTHNKVNELLGKKIFDCTKVDERWRDGPADGSCD